MSQVLGGAQLPAFIGLRGERTDVTAHVTDFLSGLALGTLYGMLGRRASITARYQRALGLTALAFLAFCWLPPLSTST